MNACNVSRDGIDVIVIRIVDVVSALWDWFGEMDVL